MLLLKVYATKLNRCLHCSIFRFSTVLGMENIKFKVKYLENYAFATETLWNKNVLLLSN